MFENLKVPFTFILRETGMVYRASQMSVFPLDLVLCSSPCLNILGFYNRNFFHNLENKDALRIFMLYSVIVGWYTDTLAVMWIQSGLVEMQTSTSLFCHKHELKAQILPQFTCSAVWRCLPTDLIAEIALRRFTINIDKTRSNSCFL